ncbi:tight adherence protein B [Branchiibius hedensis]|uniref:Tight adherence protein B n=1 Tax=Branchiibius hedensis TaxID=672460 RepID=A0A2Y9C0V8_9MICO|nr:tight adherence protein B [Branchiibius hedensis]SSA33203.1 tight adherence protein B [Branchiibius hedensis]
MIPVLLLGAGVFCLWWSWWPRTGESTRTQRVDPLTRLRDLIGQAGYTSISPGQLIAICLITGAAVFVLTMAMTSVAPVSAAFAVIAGYAPLAFVRMRARRRRTVLREVWPDVVDNISSAVRAGMALPESLAQLGVRGPEELRPAFADFAHDYRATGQFNDALDRLKDRLADPVSDRLVESLRIARAVGGTDLGRLLRTLSSFLRDDARTRAELEARQSWTVNAARLALCAPWIVLALMATRGESLQAYQSSTGVAVLAIGAAVSLVAYR